MGPTYLKINHSNLIHNYNLVKKKIGPGVKVLAVVKANAYGHGILEIAKTLEKVNVDYFGVGSPEEGVQLRKAGIKTAILVMGVHLNSQIKLQVDYDLDLTISNKDQLQHLNSYCQENNRIARIHIKIDTGMNRIGFTEQDFFEAYNHTLTCQNITIKGIYSHFSSSDEEDQSFTQQQVKRFKKICDSVKDIDTSILFHISNSAGILKSSEYWMNMVRSGILLYGNPSFPDLQIGNDFKEVMSFHSKVMLVKEIDKNEPVSYNRSYYTKKKTKIAVLPIGYADGYNRALTNNSFVLINGKRYPVVGNVCMNHTLVNLDLNSDIKAGDEVVLFGSQLNEHISISEIAKRLDTIPYEVICCISSQIERVHQF